MKMNHRQFTLLPLSLLLMGSAYAATPVNLEHQKMGFTAGLLSQPGVNIVETQRSTDMNQTLHVRIQEMYLDHPVFGADGVVHIPNGANTGKTIAAVAQSTQGSMNGILFENLQSDLAGTPSLVFSKEQASKALTSAIATYEKRIGGKPTVRNGHSELMVYVDKANKAHWAFKVSFFAEAVKEGALPAKPVMILDAISLQTYKEWNDVKTEQSNNNNQTPSNEIVSVDGGGFGGNIKMGRVAYDGLEDHLAKLQITRDVDTQRCMLANADVTVLSIRSYEVVDFKCTKTDKSHNNVYWDGLLHSVNGGYSPDNDAFFGGQVIKHMYQDWYNVPVLKNADGTPMMLKMFVHARMDNAYWDGEEMVFGDGFDMFYPLTSLGVAAHEISHGFTEQHSNLNYMGQSGGMNEAFSDMASQAAEVYAYGPGKNSWQIGPEIFKTQGEALRYMDQPSKDCGGAAPGDDCSIDDASQYNEYLDVHNSSGVYNRFFYLLGTTKGWDAKKAFDVMVQANSHYWTTNATYNEAACGVISATKDLGFDVGAVKTAFDTVKVNYSDC